MEVLRFVDVVVVVVTVKFRDLSPQTESESTKRHQVVLRLCHRVAGASCQDVLHTRWHWAWHCHSGGLLSMIASSLAKNEEPAAEGARTRGGLDHPRDLALLFRINSSGTVSCLFLNA